MFDIDFVSVTEDSIEFSVFVQHRDELDGKLFVLSVPVLPAMFLERGHQENVNRMKASSTTTSRVESTHLWAKFIYKLVSMFKQKAAGPLVSGRIVLGRSSGVKRNAIAHRCAQVSGGSPAG